MRRALTLIETLLAVTILAVTASAVLPILHRLTQHHLRLDAQVVEQNHIAEVTRADILKALDQGPRQFDVSGADGTERWLHAVPLTTDARDPAPPQVDSGDPIAFRWTSQPREWLALSITDGPEASAHVLATRLCLKPGAGTP
ncbi:MAG: type II secretion system protein [Planctomycetes bacterium]|nr:type II secretion system protein [Planctomycetota bacterium]